jgi:probable phosphoglycerate mutase
MAGGFGSRFWPISQANNPKQFIAILGNGESMLQTAHRIYGLLDQIKAGDEVYILVAHNGLVRIIESYFREMDNEEFSSIGIKNCEIKRYNF